jgi:uncharacterized protein YbjT (DUF2867 family)
MKILLTGATGYIGKRLLPVLLEKGHEVICCVRDANRLELSYQQEYPGKVSIFEVDFLEEVSLDTAPLQFDIAYYLIHSMSGSIGDFQKKEECAARNFLQFIEQSEAQQMIYLSGIVNAEALSTHLESRLAVEKILGSGKTPLTTLRAGIIVGSGSASFEIIRDLVEKLPVMVAPKWLDTKSHPIGVRNVIEFLTGVANKTTCYNQQYDIGGPDILTYKQMILEFAKVRKLRRWIFTLPIMTPRLSSYWLYFVTSTSYKLAVNLVDSMKVDVVGRPNDLAQQLGIQLIPYDEAVSMAFQRIEQNLVVSSWKDALVSSTPWSRLEPFVTVPQYGCFRDIQERSFPNENREKTIDNLWSIGGERGWYFGSFLWRLRGYVDKFFGGVGLRRGRTHPEQIHPGDALDFWRVLKADRQKGYLLLYAEMKLPGEAWLEFKIKEGNKDNSILQQTATFRPKGVLGRMYWFAVLPFHFFIFPGMLRNIIGFRG